MKKKKLKSLVLNKKSISNLRSSIVHGGSGACGIESVIICDGPATDTCSINNVECNRTSGCDGSGGNSVHCNTRPQDTCTVGASNLASPC